MSEEIDHDYTDEVVCPYCGYEFRDSWEMANDGGEQEIDCYGCEKSFLLYTNMEITYSTAKIKE
jgi:hypothetical protein